MMTWLGEFARRIDMLLHRRKFDGDLAEEVRLHLKLRQEQVMEEGIPTDAARVAAYKKFGNATLMRETAHRAWGWDWFESLLQDVTYGARAMSRSPAFTAVALLSLALGIGANTAIFSLLDAVMLRALPVKDPSQLVLLGSGTASGITSDFPVTKVYSYPFYRQFQRQNQVFSDVAAIGSQANDVHGTVEGRNASERMHVQLVSGTYFTTLGVHALLGRTLSDEDDTLEGGNPVAVVSNAWWQRGLARDPAVLGRRLKIGSTLYSIVGVAQPEFFGTKVGEAPDIWIPLSMMSVVPPAWGEYKNPFSESLLVMGRLKPGVTMVQASANVNLVYQQIMHSLSGPKVTQTALSELARTQVPLTSLATGVSSLRRQFSTPLKLLMVVVGLVLLIACANIANLLLARSTARVRELAVRQALGAGRHRMVRQLLTESLLLAVLGGVLGLGLASLASRLLLRMVSAGEDIVPLDVSIDVPLLLFTLAVTVATAILFGTIPALRATRESLTASLQSGRGPQSAGAKSLLARSLVISQVALSLVLLVGAGLFLRSLVNLNHVDPGFNKENVLRLQTDAASAGYKEDDPRLMAIYQQIEERVRVLPSVKAASFSDVTFHEGGWTTSIAVAGYNNDQTVDVRHNVVGNGYFSTMQIPLIAGRTFGPQDTASSQKVGVISDHMARTMFPRGNPIGHHYGRTEEQNANDIEVIGVVRDVKWQNLQEAAQTTDYIPYTQSPVYLDDFEVRYAGDFAAISAEVQQAIHGVDPTLPIMRVTTLNEQVARSILHESLVAQLSMFFGVLAVFLSCIGIYGLMSYGVSRRTNEIGIRMALGAARGQVEWLVMREISLLAGTGVLIGVPLTLALGRLVSSMLFGLTGMDALSLVVSIAVLYLVALAAGYLPARRASRVDPIVALRYE